MEAHQSLYLFYRYKHMPCLYQCHKFSFLSAIRYCARMIEKQLQIDVPKPFVFVCALTFLRLVSWLRSHWPNQPIALSFLHLHQNRVSAALRNWTGLSMWPDERWKWKPSNLNLHKFSFPAPMLSEKTKKHRKIWAYTMSKVFT